MCSLGSLASNMEKKTPKVVANSILEIKLENPIPEKTNNVSQTGGFEDILDNKSILGLHDIVKTIAAAKEDKNIKGIYLNLVSGPGGFATSSTLRSALEDFKSDGKFVVAYSKYMTQGGYHMSSVADEIIMNPLGFVDFRGLSSTRTFYKGMMDKMGVKMEVYYAGKFKSATEPFRRKNMSAEAKEQVRVYLNELYDFFINDIATSRDITAGQLKSYADEFIGMDINKVLEVGMIDKLAYETDVMTDLKDRVGIKEDKTLKTISLEDYHRASGSDTDYSIKDRIAVVYAEGTIVGGEGANGNTGGEKYVEILEDIRTNDKVKAVVLRVNSGGGDAMASDQMWHEIEKIKADGKPVIVSFGDVAASGGYYIACNADKIYAEPRTITGSIGVFRMFPVVQEMLEDRIGITHDTVLTGDMSAGLNPVFAPSDMENKVMQAGTEQMYQTFLQRVADGRATLKDKDAVHEIAQGRVWTSTAALENGLIDEVGSLEDAITFAAGQASLEKWRTTEYPKVKTPYEELLFDLMNPSATIMDHQMRKVLGDKYNTFKDLEQMMQSNSYQARISETIDFE